MSEKSKIFGTQKIWKNFFVDKKAQLGIIEFKFFMYGLVLGIVAGVVLAALSCSFKVLPKVALICG